MSTGGCWGWCRRASSGRRCSTRGRASPRAPSCPRARRGWRRASAPPTPPPAPDPAQPALDPILGAGERQRWATPDEPITDDADGVDRLLGGVIARWSYSITSPDAGLRCQFAAMWGEAVGWEPLASFDDDAPPVGSWCRALQPVPRASWRGAVSPRVIARQDAAQVCPYVIADVTGAAIEVGAFTGTCSWY